jgi:fructokinase
MSDEIVCVGEILWDALPDGLFLGGAPFNVACHLHALKEEVAFVSRVGDDVLGEEALRRLPARGLDAAFVQVDDDLSTGFVRVALADDTGEPDYEILEPVAWDAIALTAPLQRRAERADALVYGSLAQRAATSRQTIQRLCEIDALRVFDVNLRPPHVAREVIAHSLRAADVVKLNEHELRRLRGWFDLADGAEAAMAGLADTFGCTAVCVTWGGDGAWLWQDGDCAHHPSYPVDVADTVGAGDAFLSVLLAGLLDGRGGAALLDLANRLGAYVASHSGAFPAYEVDTLDDIEQLPLNG